jgi:hypothetical protein
MRAMGQHQDPLKTCFALDAIRCIVLYRNDWIEIIYIGLTQKEEKKKQVRGPARCLGLLFLGWTLRRIVRTSTCARGGR